MGKTLQELRDEAARRRQNIGNNPPSFLPRSTPPISAASSDHGEEEETRSEYTVHSRASHLSKNSQLLSAANLKSEHFHSTKSSGYSESALHDVSDDEKETFKESVNESGIKVYNKKSATGNQTH